MKFSFLVQSTCFASTLLLSFCSIAQGSPYGTCSNNAQFYQDQYVKDQRVSNLVCFQKALERELQSDSPTHQENKVLSYDETYCRENATASAGSQAACVAEQVKARAELKGFEMIKGDLAREKISECSSYSIGNRGTGSMENLNLVPIANCIKHNDAKKIFNQCAIAATGKAPLGYYERDAAAAIEVCFKYRLDH